MSKGKSAPVFAVAVAFLVVIPEGDPLLLLLLLLLLSSPLPLGLAWGFNPTKKASSE
jgi:hypothetical protein